MAKNKIDQINDAFIKILTRENARKYTKYIKSINAELVANIENLTPAKVKSIIKNAEINLDDIALLFMIQSVVLLIVGKKLDKKQKTSFAPMIALVAMYSLKRPERFVDKLVHINKGIGLNSNEKQAEVYLNTFKKQYTKEIVSARDTSREILDRVRLKSKLSKNMIKDFKEGLEEKKSIARIKKDLLEKNNKLTNVERTLDTELHAQGEAVREEFNKSIGMKYKIWKTQGDGKVRHTPFHDNIANKRVPIDSDFRASGLRARHPGDENLPPSERIRCRCYLEYESS